MSGNHGIGTHSARPGARPRTTTRTTEAGRSPRRGGARATPAARRRTRAVLTRLPGPLHRCSSSRKRPQTHEDAAVSHHFVVFALGIVAAVHKDDRLGGDDAGAYALAGKDEEGVLEVGVDQAQRAGPRARANYVLLAFEGDRLQGLDKLREQKKQKIPVAGKASSAKTINWPVLNVTRLSSTGGRWRRPSTRLRDCVLRNTSNGCSIDGLHSLKVVASSAPSFHVGRLSPQQP